MEDTRLSVTPSATAYLWPKIPKPSRNEIDIWKNTLLCIFPMDQNNLRIQTSIDRTWDRKYNLHYQWAISGDQEVIYQKEEETWKQWKKEISNDRYQR